MARALVSWAGSFLFAPDAPEERRLSPAAKYALILLLFIVTRLVALWGFHERQVNWAINDPQGYVLTAQYIQQHGCQPTEDNLVYRQFPGLSLIMIVANLFIGDMWTSGYVVVVLSAIAALFLVQYLFDNFRLSLISAVFLPFIITTSSTIFSEPTTNLCFLVGVWVMRDCRDRRGLLCVGLLIAGCSVVVRPPALLATFPFLFVYAWRGPGGSLTKSVVTCAIAAIPLALFLAWSWFTIHQFFPQFRLQHENLLLEISRNGDPSHYSASMYALPFSSLVNGLTDPMERPWKKASEVATTLVGLIALSRLAYLAWSQRSEQRGVLPLAFLAGMVPYFLLLLCLGGNFGYKWMERHLSEINPIVDWALFYQRHLRWPWIALLIVAGVIFAIGTGAGTSFLIFK